MSSENTNKCRSPSRFSVEYVTVLLFINAIAENLTGMVRLFDPAEIECILNEDLEKFSGQIFGLQY